MSSIVSQAVRIGLGGIAICDHDSLGGSLEAERIVEENGIDLVVIPGIEVTTTRGHLLVLGTREELPANEDPRDIISIAQRQEYLVVAPHPYKGYPKSLGDVSDLEVDAVETLNSRFITGKFNKRAERMAMDLKIPMLGNSDAHYVEMVGRAFTEIDSQPSVDSIFDAIVSGETRVHGERTPFRLQFRQACGGFKRRTGNLIKR